jgi:thiol:disulfide interchange protein
MGLGMALPYLVIGAFPKLIGMLPRPGNWMVTFKHAMGYAMLGAAIFLFGSLKDKFEIPTLTMALAIGIACSIIGHTSIAAELGQKLRSWTYGLAVIALGCWFAFFILVPQHELDWKTFSKVALKEELDKGNIVFIDFTADW